MKDDGDVHPSAALDEVVHQRARLGILSILAEAEDADFTYLRRALGLTDGNLGRHLEVLAGADFVTMRKGRDGRRSKTWVQITPRGREALMTEIALLKVLVAPLDPEADQAHRRGST